MQEGLSMPKAQYAGRKGRSMQAGWSWAQEANLVSFVECRSVSAIGVLASAQDFKSSTLL